jgi:hypothetical protein
VIGNAFVPGRGFKGLALYLEHGHPGAEVRPDRVAWIETRNLPTNNLHAAARIMAATARDSDSVQPPLYHFTISFDPHDPVDEAIMRQVAHRTLREVGLNEHQAVIVAHRDRAHWHLHIMVNRVHPETLKVWNNWFDYGRIERSLRKQEEELGLRMVPGKHSRVPEHAPQRTPAPRRIRGNAEFLARVQAQARPHLLGARSWDEVERGLGEYGLSVQFKHGGMVVTDGTYEVKASEIDRAASRKHLEHRLGPLGDHRARQAVAARTLDERAERVADPRPEPQVQQRGTPAPERAPIPVPPAKVEHRRVAASYRAAMERLYLAAHRARAAFRMALVRDGREAATKALRERPESFGPVRPGTASVEDRAQEAAREAFRWSGRLEASGRADALRVADALSAPPTSRAAEAQRLADAGKRLNAWERVGRSLAPKLAPMLPARAAGLVRTAKSLGRNITTAAEPDRNQPPERGRDPDRGPDL